MMSTEIDWIAVDEAADRVKYLLNTSKELCDGFNIDPDGNNLIEMAKLLSKEHAIVRSIWKANAAEAESDQWS